MAVTKMTAPAMRTLTLILSSEPMGFGHRELLLSFQSQPFDVLWSIKSKNPLEIQTFWEREVSKHSELKIKPKIGLSQLGWDHFPPVGQALKDFSVHAENQHQINHLANLLPAFEQGIHLHSYLFS